MGFSSGWQGYSSEFPSDFALGKFLGAALPALGNPVLPSSFTQINPLHNNPDICLNGFSL